MIKNLFPYDFQDINEILSIFYEKRTNILLIHWILSIEILLLLIVLKIIIVVDYQMK